MKFFLSKKKVFAFLIIPCFLVFLGIFWHKVLEPRIFPKRWGEVEKGLLFRSGRIHPSLVEEILKKHNIKLIIDLDEESPKTSKEREAAEKLGIKIYYFRISGDGIAKNPDDYVNALKLIHESLDKKEAVLVHCAAGSQRTSVLVAIYEMLVKKKDKKEVFEDMLEKDFDAKKEVIEFMNQNMEFFAQRLFELGIIDQIPDTLPQM
ncbi:MAG: dual specificity protein phosphatase family protein [Candidatus Nanoarchaeia archaeon]